MNVRIHRAVTEPTVEDACGAHDGAGATPSGPAAAGLLDLPIMVIDLGDFTVRAASNAALELLGKPASDVIGRPAVRLVAPGEKASTEAALGTLRAGVVDFYRSWRNSDPVAGSKGPLTVWPHAVQLSGERVALVELASGREPQPSPLVRYLGREPLEMAIGTTDASWVVTSISSDVESLLGIPSADIVGRPLLGLVQQDDLPRLLDADVRRHDAQSVSLRVEMRTASAEWTRVCCVLASFAGTTDRYFILLSDQDAAADDGFSRSCGTSTKQRAKRTFCRLPTKPRLTTLLPCARQTRKERSIPP